jgi:hypothetical protein
MELQHVATELRYPHMKLFAVQCLSCGKQLHPRRRANIERPRFKGSSYCSKECRRPDLERRCCSCGRQFHAGQTGNRTNRNKYCSKDCYRRWQLSEENRGAKHPNFVTGIENRPSRHRREYASWRHAVFERDNWTCRKCGERGRKLHAHHVRTVKAYPHLELSIRNGCTLCVPCHKDVHKGKRKKIYRVKNEKAAIMR